MCIYVFAGRVSAYSGVCSLFSFFVVGLFSACLGFGVLFLGVLVLLRLVLSIFFFLVHIHFGLR